MVSIKDIAQELGVNSATVSRALNDRSGVSEELRSKIKAYAKERGYSRNPFASGLSGSKSKIIGFIVPDITNPYYSFIAKGISAEIEKKGYSLLLCNTDRKPENEKRFIEMLCEYRVSGVIILSVTATEADIQPFFDKNISVVCIDNPLSKKISCVMNDNYSGTCDLIEHILTRSGVERLAIIMGSPNVFTTKERLRACYDTAKNLGKEDSIISVEYINPIYEEGYRITPIMLQKKPDAIFAINDIVALGVLNYCHDHGIKVPQDLKVAGYDDMAVTSMLNIPLTTVHQRKISLGIKAANELLHIIDNPSSSINKIELFPKLVVRASCGDNYKRDI